MDTHTKAAGSLTAFTLTAVTQSSKEEQVLTLQLPAN